MTLSEAFPLLNIMGVENAVMGDADIPVCAVFIGNEQHGGWVEVIEQN